jgi:hypothetical protein
LNSLYPAAAAAAAAASDDDKIKPQHNTILLVLYGCETCALNKGNDTG